MPTLSVEYLCALISEQVVRLLVRVRKVLVINTDQMLSGTKLSKDIKEQLATDIETFVQKTGIRPGLAVILVGERPDSSTYVSMKRKACVEVGIDQTHCLHLPETITSQQLLAHIDALNENPLVHGILVQLPLPAHIPERTVLDRIRPDKDVDGLSVQSTGKLCLGNSEGFVPCTPLGCMELIRSTGIRLEGCVAVVVGRSGIVGKPMGMLLLKENATVITCHSRTKDLGKMVELGDVVVVAAGHAGLIKGEWIKKGAVVIDVGINAVDDPTKKRGYRLVGDVEYEKACCRAAFITPVPGGVGPMTIAMLLRNTFKSALESIEHFNSEMN